MSDTEREKRIYELLQEKQSAGAQMSQKESRILELMNEKYAAQDVPDGGTTADTPRNLFGLPDRVEKAVFPSTGVQATGKRPGIVASAIGGLEALGTPTRALGMLRGYDISDPESNIVRPEIEKTKGFLDKSMTPYDINLRRTLEPVKNIGKGIVEIVGGAAGDPLTYASGLVKGAAKTLKKPIGKIASEVSGVPEDALRAYGTGIGPQAQAIRKAAGTEARIANRVVDAIENFDEYIPEKAVVNNALEQMPPMDFQKVMQVIDDAKVIEGSDAARAANRKLDRIKNLWSELTVEKGPELYGPAGQKLNTDKIVKIPAKDFRKVRKQLDQELKSAFSKDQGVATIMDRQLTKVRKAMKDALIESAESSGNPEYVQAMKTYSDKLQKLEKVKGYLGGNQATRERRAQQFVDSVFGKNKDNARRVMSDIQDIVGEDFLGEAQAAQFAEQLGPGGVPAFFPRQPTGRSGMAAVGGLGGLFSGNPMAMAVGAETLALASPKLAAGQTGLLEAASKMPIVPPISGTAQGITRVVRPEDEEYIRDLRSFYRR